MTAHTPTLLEDLCKAARQSGGTIHQFVDMSDRNIDDMRKAHSDYIRMGIKFQSKASLDKLASQYHVTIHWGQK